MTRQSRRTSRPVTSVHFRGDGLELLRRAAGQNEIGDFVRASAAREAERILNIHAHLNGVPVIYAHDFHATLEGIEGMVEHTQEIMGSIDEQLKQQNRFGLALAAEVAVTVECLQLLITLTFEEGTDLSDEFQAINKSAAGRFDAIVNRARKP